MKKIYSILMMFAMMFATLSFAACSSDDDDEVMGSNLEYVGTWSLQYAEGYGYTSDDFEYIQLKSNGTFIDVQEDSDFEDGYTVDRGKWTVSNNSLVLHIETGILAGSTFSYDIIKKEKDKMTVTMWGATAYLIRVSDDIIEKYI